MSAAAIDWAFKIALPPPAKLVLLAIADRANGEGKSWPSVPDICNRTGLGDRTVQRAIKLMVDNNTLAIETRSGRSTVYSLPVSDENTPVTVTPTPVTLTPHPRHSDTDPRQSDAQNLERNLEENQERNRQTSARGRACDLPEGFNEFWDAYPRKVGKGQAIRAYRAALKVAEAGAILTALVRYPFPLDTPQFVPHASTWLNGLRWLDCPTRPATLADRMRRLVDADPEPASFFDQPRLIQ